MLQYKRIQKYCELKHTSIIENVNGVIFFENGKIFKNGKICLKK